MRDAPFGPEISADVQEFVALANEHRSSVGCGPLEWRSDVGEVAQGHSDDTVSRDFFSHTNPDGAGHRANLENCSLTQHGVGPTETHWTHLFLTP